MSPMDPPNTTTRPSVPRASGDEPPYPEVVMPSILCSPRERG